MKIVKVFLKSFNLSQANGAQCWSYKENIDQKFITINTATNRNLFSVKMFLQPDL